MSNVLKLYLFILIIVTVTIWLAVFSLSPKKLKLVACDVGQGDSILASYGNFQILTDGGLPNGKVVECLSRYMPFWDRTLDVVINTHPQLDHYGGLIKVIEDYNVLYFIANPLKSSSREYQVLQKLITDRGIRVVTPLKGMGIRYGSIHYDIFFPTKTFLMSQGWKGEVDQLGTFDSNRDPNDFSIQAVLSFGEFDALLTGDIGANMKNLVIENISKKQVEYIKVPHHGSKYGITPDYIDIFKPKMAVIQVGKNNYGHPTQEILNMLANNKIETFRNDLDGDIVVESDGESFWKVD